MVESPPQDLVDFVHNYEQRTNSHEFSRVKPLIDSNAIYWFSDGSHEGIEEIESAFTQAWNTIRNEVYTIKDVRWLTIDERSASCVYTFHWEGEVDDEWKSGSGRGTSVLAKEESGWKVIHEHLSSNPVKG